MFKCDSFTIFVILKQPTHCTLGKKTYICKLNATEIVQLLFMKPFVSLSLIYEQQCNTTLLQTLILLTHQTK